jgi:hypothetical protein
MSGRRADRVDSAVGSQSGDGLTLAVLAICGGWLLLALVAMLVSSSPDLGPVSGSAQHLLLGLVLSIMVAAALALVTNRRAASVAWAAVVSTGVALVAYELLQLAVPVRSFQWADLSYGVTGVTIGGLVALLGMQFRDSFTAGVAGFGGVALVLSAVGFVILPRDELRVPVGARLADCAALNQQVSPDWDRQILALSETDAGCVAAGGTSLVPFGASLAVQPAGSTGVRLDGGGLLSGPLTGLPDAIEATDALSFGVRFESTTTGEDVVPIVLARITIDGDPARPIAQILQRGPHLTVNVGAGRPVVNVGLPLVDRARPGTFQELVVTYQAGVATAYLNGQLVGKSSIDAFEFVIDGPLTLEVGWRADERWQPLRGTVASLLIADRALEQNEVAVAFQD